MNFTPCSAKHGKYCSPAHAALVRGYREERQRQELALEESTGNYPGDIKHWKENGGTLINFKTWLKGNKGSGHIRSEQRGNRVCTENWHEQDTHESFSVPAGDGCCNFEHVVGIARRKGELGMHGIAAVS